MAAGTDGPAPPGVGERPLDLLGVLDLSEIEPGPGTRHTEILTRAGRLGLLWDGAFGGL